MLQYNGFGDNYENVASRVLELIIKFLFEVQYAGWRSASRRYKVLAAASKEFIEVFGDTFTFFWNKYAKAEGFACSSGKLMFHILNLILFMF